MTKNRLIKTLCQACYFFCGLDIMTSKGHIEKIYGTKENLTNRGSICPKGIASQHLITDPRRLRKPLRRKGPRGSNSWEEISWEKAMTEVTERISDIRNKYGAPSLAFYRGQAPGWITAMNYTIRFMNTFGSPNLFTHSHLCFRPRAIAHIATYGGVPEPDFEKANCIMLWGFNPVYTSLTNYGRRTIEAKKRGAKLIVIDPCFTQTASKADLWLQPEPGTDLNLALGMAKVLIDENLYDQDFVKKYTSGWDSLLSTLESIKYEEIEATTGVPLLKIKQAARMFALNSPAVLKEGNGLDQHVNVVQTVRAISILISLTGNINREGSNILVPILPFVDVQARGKIPEDWSSKAAILYPLFFKGGNSLHSNEFLNALETGKPLTFHSLIIQGGDLVAANSNIARTKILMQKLDFIVVQDLFLTASGEMADIVLPAASFLERDHLLYYKYRPNAGINMVGLQNIVVPPVGESHTDLEFIFELAQRLGLKSDFPWKNVKEAFDWELAPLGITTEYFKAHPEGYVREYSPEELFVEKGRITFPTPSGKIELNSSEFKKYGYDPVPKPKTFPEELKTNEKYPIICGTGLKLGIYTHTQFQSLKWIEEIESEPFLEIHPEMAEEYKLNDRDLVRIKTSWGSLTVPIRITKTVKKNNIVLSYGWGQPYTNKKWDFANSITPHSPADPISGATSNRRVPCSLTLVKKSGDKLSEEWVLLADLDSCVGCYACEVACLQEHGQKSIKVKVFGPEKDSRGESIMECIPQTHRSCDLCWGRIKEGKEPACVKSCPTKALTAGKVLNLLPDLKEKRVQIIRLLEK